jgi:hypothetical protein
MNNKTQNQFQVGKTYTTRSACDYDCIFSFNIVKTSKSSVWFTGSCTEGVQRRAVKSYNGKQYFSPLGTYSMSPTINA